MADQGSIARLNFKCLIALTRQLLFGACRMAPNEPEQSFTKLGVFTLDDTSVYLIEKALEISVDEIRTRTEASFRVASGVSLPPIVKKAF